jgi:hypothetical protein
VLQRELQSKLDALKKHEQDMFAAAQDPATAAEAAEEGFTARLIRKIVDNLQVTITRVHVRFEESRPPQCEDGRPSTSIGLAIRELSGAPMCLFFCVWRNKKRTGGSWTFF